MGDVCRRSRERPDIETTIVAPGGCRYCGFQWNYTGVRLPKSTLEEIDTRTLALHEATKIAIETPLQTMRIAYEAIDLIAKMVTDGIPSSVSDAAVGGLCLDAAIKGANYNVRINLKDFADEVYSQQILAEADSIMSKSAPKLIEIERNIKKIINL